MNFVCTKRPNIIELQERYGLELAFHPSLTSLYGDDVQKLLNKYTSESIDILAVEGGVLTAPDNTGQYHEFAGRTFKEWVEDIAENAIFVLALGSCSAYGGIPSISPNVGDIVGLQFTHRKVGGLLGRRYRSRSGLPVINVPGCPVHWMNVVSVLIDICQKHISFNELDEFNRPKNIFKDFLHHGCPRNEYFEYKQEALKVGEPGCMYENLGCHGPLVRCNANIHRWFDGWGSCTWAGFPCIGCVSPGFPEESFPVFETQKIADIPVNLPEGVEKAAYLQSKIMGQQACPERLKLRNGRDKK